DPRRQAHPRHGPDVLQGARLVRQRVGLLEPDARRGTPGRSGPPLGRDAGAIARGARRGAHDARARRTRGRRPHAAGGGAPMNRTPLSAGNWKMHGARGEAVALASALAKGVGRVRGREVVIAPPFTALEAVRPAIAGTDIRLAGQNVHWDSKGAYTGEIA